MSRASFPAAPCVWINDGDLNVSAPDGEVVPPSGMHRMYGLTIREHLAGLAMQGLLSKYSLSKPEDFEIVSQAAVRQADFLIAELAKVKS